MPTWMWLALGAGAYWYVSQQKTPGAKTCVGWQLKGWNGVYTTRDAAIAKAINENNGKPLTAAQINSVIVCVRTA